MPDGQHMFQGATEPCRWAALGIHPRRISTALCATPAVESPSSQQKPLSQSPLTSAAMRSAWLKKDCSCTARRSKCDCTPPWKPEAAKVSKKLCIRMSNLVACFRAKCKTSFQTGACTTGRDLDPSYAGEKMSPSLGCHDELSLARV